MEEEKFNILNDSDLEIRGSILRPKKAGKFPLLVIAHDFLDAIDAPYLKELIKLALDQNFAVLKFDFTNGFGKSDGRAENITISQRARDLELATQYAKRRSYINENKTSIIGFGFGGLAGLALEGFHTFGKALILINTPCQLEETGWTSFPEREMQRVKLKRYFHVMRDGQEVRINYTFYEDGSHLDTFRCARNLRTPVLFIHGADNTWVAPSHSERLYERTNCKKELDIIPGLGHEMGKRQVTLVWEKTLDFIRRQKAM